MTIALFISILGTVTAVWVLTAPMPSAAIVQTYSGIDARRRGQLAMGSLTYQWCGGIVSRLANGPWWPAKVLKAVELRLNRAGQDMPWRASEWLASTFLEAILLGLAAAAAYTCIAGIASRAGYLCIGVAAAYIVFVWRSLKNRAQLRLGAIRTRVPFVIDSIALSLEAGLGISEALFLTVDSCSKSAIGEELTDVANAMRRGQPLAESLTLLKSRLQEPMINEFILTISTSHQLGASVSDVLLDMSKRMRTRRSHEIESAVGRAQIQLYYPGTLLLVVCMVAVVAPFVAPMWHFLDGTTQ